eukprot:CAMPEP_0171469204 /NCGR_PEP_ID=MMETSP0945-20130129/11141_1 /TAXON_ID=109269 /ORGANISM="Vaucheria litorea, Strain CCMP2940" /LENGTH=132 /DNA_ID=CAMNT_0011998295 /DNA_START=188 /DNA_END=586 /DNA_ORIENTATION=-
MSLGPVEQFGHFGRNPLHSELFPFFGETFELAVADCSRDAQLAAHPRDRGPFDLFGCVVPDARIEQIHLLQLLQKQLLFLREPTVGPGDSLGFIGPFRRVLPGKQNGFASSAKNSLAIANTSDENPFAEDHH